MPRIAGERLPATYINHYTANGGAVVPQFGYAAAGTDERALEDIYQVLLSPPYNATRFSLTAHHSAPYWWLVRCQGLSQNAV